MTHSDDRELAAIALGSNQGDSLRILEGAIAQLQKHPQIDLSKQSPWYQTKPLGPPQPDYINGCVLVQTSASPSDLMQYLLEVEHQFGRQRLIHWGPRTLDLDLLLFGDVIQTNVFLTLPHPHLHERSFVLQPLADIYPTWIHPQLQQSVQALLRKVDTSDLQQI